MAKVTILDKDGQKTVMDAVYLEILRTVDCDRWLFNAADDKCRVVCPLDAIDILTINGVEVKVRIIEASAYHRGMRKKRRKQ